MIALLLLSFAMGAYSQSSDFDYFLFVQQWPDQGPVPGCVYGFTIHGLWPNDDDGSYPKYCEGNQFDPSSISSIESELKCAWPSDDGTDAHFWGHEWNKHGTCAVDGDSGLTGELDFFQTTLNLYNQFNITAPAVQLGVDPKKGGPVSSAALRSQISNTIGGYSVVLQCTKSAAQRRTSQLRGMPIVRVGNPDWDPDIESVIICVDKSFRPMDCPSSELSQDDCGSGDVWFNALQ